MELICSFAHSKQKEDKQNKWTGPSGENCSGRRIEHRTLWALWLRAGQSGPVESSCSPQSPTFNDPPAPRKHSVLLPTCWCLNKSETLLQLFLIETNNCYDFFLPLSSCELCCSHRIVQFLNFSNYYIDWWHVQIIAFRFFLCILHGVPTFSDFLICITRVDCASQLIWSWLLRSNMKP